MKILVFGKYCKKNIILGNQKFREYFGPRQILPWIDLSQNLAFPVKKEKLFLFQP